MFKLPTKLYATLITIGVIIGTFAVMFVSFKILSNTYGQHLNDDTMDTLVEVLVAVCNPDNTLSADHNKTVGQCEALVPGVFRQIYNSCVREAMNITEITQPFICYRFLKGSDRLTECMLRWERRGSMIGLEVPRIRDRILNKYSECMKPVVPVDEETDADY
ncbi:unnamed protein product [Medioppia subpectinata]|uniref:Uncharacterized protein n=1 Tax=Medioppia subpectinata TaxID=1979941 RepID=A0A7R9KZ04_9ACAR|nr:unnamed protein product [Medioppia subpectinata]CAG2112507.1 unnamed protein product [Medioppia subpectinata]